MKITRAWAMPSPWTFSIKPIGEFVRAYLARSSVSVDPFAGQSRLATHRNDIRPECGAGNGGVDAVTFLKGLHNDGVRCDLLLFDPPYSPRQISEVYKGLGRVVGTKDTQSASLYRRARDAADLLIQPGGIALSFGWNSVGMGIGRGYEIVEILLVCHGGAHNDTICVAERKHTASQDQGEILCA